MGLLRGYEFLAYRPRHHHWARWLAGYLERRQPQALPPPYCASFTSITWWAGIWARIRPARAMKDFFLNSVPTMAEFTAACSISWQALFFVCLGVTALGGVLKGSLLDAIILGIRNARGDRLIWRPRACEHATAVPRDGIGRTRQ